MKSARFESSSSPTGESSDSGSCEMPQDLAHPIGLESAPCGQLLDRRLALELLVHLALHPEHPVHALHHVHRDADRAGLVGDRPGDRLADPPRGVRRELEALRVVELVDRPHQAEVALLDEVEELHPAPRVALGDAHDEPQVGLDQLALGRSPRLTAASAALLDAARSVTAPRRRSARRRCLPSSIRCAGGARRPTVSRSTRPISSRYMRTGSDVPP